jgi:hypothetical protein
VPKIEMMSQRVSFTIAITSDNGKVDYYDVDDDGWKIWIKHDGNMRHAPFADPNSKRSPNHRSALEIIRAWVTMDGMRNNVTWTDANLSSSVAIGKLRYKLRYGK